MEVGQKVVSKLYENYGEGKVISKRNVFGEEFLEVFFENVNETLEIHSDNLRPIEGPLDLFRSGAFDNPEEFKLKFLAHQIEALTSGEEALSPANFKIKPIPHQLLALDFVTHQFRPRCLLADEVGLGKTIEAALMMEELKLRDIANRILIVTPPSLTNQWRDELKLKFSEDLPIIDGESVNSFKQLYGEETNFWTEFEHAITSMDFLKPRKLSDEMSESERERRIEHNEYVFENCVNANWDMVIIDEAHKLSKYKDGTETARFKLGKRLSESVPVFLILTATPHRGKPHVYKNLLSLVDPYSFNRLEDLTPSNVKRITVRNRKRACVDFDGERLFKDRITSLCKINWENGVDDPERKLYHKVAEYIEEYYDHAKKENNNTLIFLLMLYQRIVSSSSRAILKSLQKRLDRLRSLIKKAKRIQETSLDDFLELAGERQLEELKDIVPALKNPKLVKKEIDIVSECIELAKDAVIGRNDAKLRKLLEIIDDVKRRESDKNVKILVFTEFIETQKYIIESLEKLGYETAFINGRLDLSERITQKKKFRDDAQIMVSTDAGGEGINLQFCHVVINYDLPWNPMKVEQRIGRVDRIGQEEDVLAINFILADTIEERVREKIEEKLELVREQFGEDKLQDILYSLDEEISFDRLYIEFISKERRGDEELEEISEEIYNKAKEILKNNEMLVPFSEADELEKCDIDELKEISEKTELFTELFLDKRELDLKEYRDEEKVFYFDNDFRTDVLPESYSNVIFDQKKAMDIEDAELFSFAHPFVEKAVSYVKYSGRTSSFYINHDKFSGEKGVLFNFILTIKNNYDMKRGYDIPVFIDRGLKFNRRISNYLDSLEEFDLANCEMEVPYDIESYFEKAREIADEFAESIFLDAKKDWKSQIENDRKRMEKYYKQRKKAIDKIKIENIRKGKHKELRKEKSQKMLELNQKAKLFPELECCQIALIDFR